MSRQWPITYNHYNNSSNFYTWRRKYFFYDKNSDTFDLNDHMSKIQASISKNSSHIVEGLIPKQTTTTEIKIGLGSFFHVPSINIDHIFGQPYFKGINPSTDKNYVNNLHKNAALVHVGHIFDALTQTTTTSTVHLRHKAIEGTINDPTYGEFIVNSPTIHVAADSVRENEYFDEISGVNARQLNIDSSGGQGIGEGRDVYVSYMPDTTAAWITAVDQGITVIEPSTQVDGSKIINVNTTVTLDDIGKTVQIKGSTLTGREGQKRKIIKIIDEHTFEVDEQFNVGNPSYLIGGSTLYIYDGESLLSSSGTRYDILGIRRKTYENEKIILQVDETGTPAVSTETARYFTTWELVIIDDVPFKDTAKNIIDFDNIDDTDTFVADKLQKLADMIPIALVEVTDIGATMVSSSKPWITSFRERESFEHNLISNGSFLASDSTADTAGTNDLLGQGTNWIVGSSASYLRETDSDNVLFGTRSAKVNRGANEESLAYRGKLCDLGIHPGDIVNFSAWVKNGTATSGSVMISLSNNTDGSSAIMEVRSDNAVTDTGAYELVKANALIPHTSLDAAAESIDPNSTYIFFWLEIQGSAGEDVYTDGWNATVDRSKYHYRPHYLTDMGDQVINGTLIVEKDLFVNGTQTVINTEIMEVEDAQIVLNKDGNNASMTVGHTDGAGILIESVGVSDSAYFLYHPDFDLWKIGNSAKLTVNGLSTLDNVLIGSGNINDIDINIGSGSFDLSTTPINNVTMTDRMLSGSWIGRGSSGTDTGERIQGTNISILDAYDLTVEQGGQLTVLDSNGNTNDVGSAISIPVNSISADSINDGTIDTSDIVLNNKVFNVSSATSVIFANDQINANYIGAGNIDLASYTLTGTSFNGLNASSISLKRGTTVGNSESFGDYDSSGDHMIIGNVSGDGGITIRSGSSYSGSIIFADATSSDTPPTGQSNTGYKRSTVEFSHQLNTLVLSVEPLYSSLTTPNLRITAGTSETSPNNENRFFLSGFDTSTISSDAIQFTGSGNMTISMGGAVSLGSTELTSSTSISASTFSGSFNGNGSSINSINASNVTSGYLSNSIFNSSTNYSNIRDIGTLENLYITSDSSVPLLQVINTDIDEGGDALLLKVFNTSNNLAINAVNNTNQKILFARGDRIVEIHELQLDTVLEVQYGGTGASNAVNARANLGLIINSDVADIAQIFSGTAGNYARTSGSGWATATAADLKADVGTDSGGSFINSSIGTGSVNTDYIVTGDILFDSSKDALCIGTNTNDTRIVIAQPGLDGLEKAFIEATGSFTDNGTKYDTGTDNEAVILLSPGKYVIYKPIHINAQGLTIIGLGRVGIRYHTSVGDVDAMVHCNAHDITLKGLAFYNTNADLDPASETKEFIRIGSGYDRTHVEKCQFWGNFVSGSDHAIAVWGQSGSDQTRTINCEIFQDTTTGSHSFLQGATGYQAGNFFNNSVSDQVTPWNQLYQDSLS